MCILTIFIFSETWRWTIKIDESFVKSSGNNRQINDNDIDNGSEWTGDSSWIGKVFRSVKPR